MSEWRKCTPDRGRLAKRVLLIGWDAVDWTTIRPLIDRGMMPTLAKLIEEGVSGNLATIRPVVGPMLWSSVATGKRADKHGVLGYVEPNRDRTGIRPVGSATRKCKALWNILSQSGMAATVVAWPASHPAESIHGAVVTDRICFASDSEDQDGIPTATFYPRSLSGEIEPLVVRAKEVGPDTLRPFFSRAGQADDLLDDRRQRLAGLIARTSTVHAAACRLAADRQWDLLAVHYPSPGDFRWHFGARRQAQRGDVSERDEVIAQDLVTGCHRFQDMMLESLLAHAGADVTTILVSTCTRWESVLGNDMGDGTDQPQSAFGVVCVRGPRIRFGEPLYGATLLGVAPTVLTLLGLPVGEDMDGRPWLGILDNAAESPARIESWETAPGGSGRHAEGADADPADQVMAIRDLVALGEFGPAEDDLPRTIRAVERLQKTNLAIALTDSDRVAKALRLWSELASEAPRDPRFVCELAACCLRCNRPRECREAIEQMDAATRETPRVQIMLAELTLREGQLETALSIARGVAAGAGNEPGLLKQIGKMFLRAESWADAETAFSASLAILGDDPIAHDGLAVACLKQGRYVDAVAHAQQAVKRIPHFSPALFHLGQSLRSAGRDVDAIAAFERCLETGYRPAETHRQLAALFRFIDPDKARYHERRANAL